MAGVVRSLGRGGQGFAETKLNWNRGLIRKGEKELSSGVDQVDRFHDRGRKPITDRLPTIREDIVEIVRPQSQTDPSFKSTRIYTPITAGEILKRLSELPQYKGVELPCERTIRNQLVKAEIFQKKIAKTKPKKKIPETNAIFEEVHRINDETDANPRKLRISLDSKAVVKIGDFDRGGKSLQDVPALDHDFNPITKMVPFGIFLPETNENFFFFSATKATADFMVDQIEVLWPELKKRCPEMETLVINADNGPESSGQRTQWLKRLVDFANSENITIELAYYPPYHSKYNPIERCWGLLENHWNSELLNSVEKTLGMARSMTYNGVNPIVDLVKKVYHKGVKLTKKAMIDVEAQLNRKTGFEKWFITICPKTDFG